MMSTSKAYGLIGLTTALLLVVGLGTAHADDATDQTEKQVDNQTKKQAQQADSEVEPTITHHPVASLTSDRRVRIDTRIDGDWKLEQAWVGVRPMNSSADYRTIALERTGDEEFAAIVPAELVEPPGLEYYIASRAKDGRERTHFTSQDKPHRLLVEPTDAEHDLNRRLARYDGNRSQFQLRGEYISYGPRQVRSYNLGGDVSGDDLVSDAGSDTYWVTELEYTYRVLSWLHDIRFGLGRLRGSQPTVTIEGEARPLAFDENATDPGYDYGFGEANLAFHENFSLGLRLVLGASDDGFAAGGGALFRIGPMSGTHLELGGELQAEIGNRGWMSFAWDTVPKVPMALTIELSERPNDSGPTGTRLLYDVGLETSESLTLDARVGYASRSGGIEGGFVAGLGATYEF
jgi:hypothetical protein